MTLEEIQQAYPNATYMVLGHERNLLPIFWYITRCQAEREGFQAALDNLKNNADKVVKKYPDRDFALHRQEMETEDFAKYVQAKLGMM